MAATLLPQGDTVSINDPELLRKINDLRRTDNVTNWFYLAREYLFLTLVIGGTIASYYQIEPWNISWLWAVPVTLLCIFAVGAGQHRLSTLTHEAAHYMLFHNRLLNEIISEWFCMFPVLGATHPYRVQHLGHHQHSNDPERDPDWGQLLISGHRFKFPMSQGRFLWECVLKQILWPPNPIRYILARAMYVVDQGENSPYRLKRRPARIMKIFGILYALSLLAALTCLVWLDETVLLTAVPVFWLVGLAFYLAAPDRWFGEYFIQSDLRPRWQVCLRLTYYTLAWSALAWMTLLTSMPWWLFYLVLWVTPLGTSFAFFMILRQLVQHGNADRGRFTNTRNFEVHPIISFAVFPIGNDYHLPHHLFPMVPHYNLRKAHALLVDVEEYQQHAVLVEGYFLHAPTANPTVLDVMSAPAPD